MRFEAATISSYAPKTKFVVVCHEGDYDDVLSSVCAYAPLGWKEKGEIRVVEAGTRVRFRSKGPTTAETEWRREVRQDSALLRRTLDDVAPPGEGARVIVVGNLQVSVGQEMGDLRSMPLRFSNASRFATALPTLLAQSQLDWISSVANSLEHYHHEPITREMIEDWRSQFKQASAGWIGDAILKLIDVWPSSKVCDHLLRRGGESHQEQERWLQSYDVVAFNEARSGNSSAIVCRFAKKRFSTFNDSRRVDFARHVRDSPSSRMLFLEDCLMTGSEVIKLFQRVPAEAIKKHEIDLHFATGTSFGRERLHAFLRREQLSTVHILEPVGGFLQNLSDTGLAAARDGLLLDDQFELADRDFVVDGITLGARGYFNDNQRKRIVRFCERIGCPLMISHLGQKGWPDERIAALMPSWGLGPSGLGMLTVFAHGVPKPALPILWLGGEIHVNLQAGHDFFGTWYPLFGKVSNRDA